MKTSDFGELMDSQTSSKLLKVISTFLNIKSPITKFIGSHPLTLTKLCINDLLEEDYLVCEKSDGIRALIFVHNKVFYLYDRKNLLYKTRYTADLEDSYLFDSEIYQENSEFVLAIFDTLLTKSKNYLQETLIARLTGANKFVMHLKTPGITRISDNESIKRFKITVKQMTKSYGFYQVLDSISELKHENDGLIFTPVHEPYIIHRVSKIYKWKPPSLNTIDFQISNSTAGKDAYDLYGILKDEQIPRHMNNTFKGHNRDLYKFGTFYTTEKLNITERNSLIGEFKYDDQKEVVDRFDYTITFGGWELHKIRSDKDTPNNFKVIFNIIKSINENITENELRKYWKEMMTNYKKRIN